MIYLIVDQTPLLQETMNTHDGSHITGQISAARCDGQVLARVETVRVDHEIAVILVYTGCLAAISFREEFRQGATLDGVNRRQAEP